MGAFLCRQDALWRVRLAGGHGQGQGAGRSAGLTLGPGRGDTGGMVREVFRELVLPAVLFGAGMMLVLALGRIVVGLCGEAADLIRVRRGRRSRH